MVFASKGRPMAYQMTRNAGPGGLACAVQAVPVVRVWSQWRPGARTIDPVPRVHAHVPGFPRVYTRAFCL